MQGYSEGDRHRGTIPGQSPSLSKAVWEVAAGRAVHIRTRTQGEAGKDTARVQKDSTCRSA